MELKQPRLASIDSLRGLAAIYVVFYHAKLVAQPNLAVPSGIDPFVLFGGTGVILFFVISGFSLSMTMARHHRAPSPILSYGIARYFRIAPMFYFALAASVIRDDVVFHSSPWPANIVANVLFVFNFFPGHQEGIVWASWTVGVEMVFYLVFPAIAELGIKYKIAIMIATLAGFEAMSRFSWASGLYVFSFLGFIPIFIAGEMCFVVYSCLHRLAQPRVIGTIISFAGAMLLLCCIAMHGSATSQTMRYPIGLGYALVVLGLTLRPFAVLEAPLLVFYGRISYSLYLFHAPIIFALSPLFRRLAILLPASLAYLACALTALALATAAGWIGYRAVERPGIRLGNALNRWSQDRAALLNPGTEK